MLRHFQHQPLALIALIFRFQRIQDCGQGAVKPDIHHSANHLHHPSNTLLCHRLPVLKFLFHRLQSIKTLSRGILNSNDLNSNDFRKLFFNRSQTPPAYTLFLS